MDWNMMTLVWEKDTHRTAERIICEEMTDRYQPTLGSELKINTQQVEVTTFHLLLSKSSNSMKIPQTRIFKTQYYYVLKK